MLGGSPRSKIVRESRKDTTVKFMQNESASQSLVVRNQLMREYAMLYADENIYTITAIFVKAHPALALQLEDMIEKTAHYTSFEHFLDELQSDRFPDMRDATENELEKLRESNGALSLYLHFKYLCKCLGRDPNDYVKLFLSKLQHDIVRDSVNKQCLSQEERRDLSFIAHYCDSLQTRLGLRFDNHSKKTSVNVIDRDVNNRNNASIDTKNTSETASVSATTYERGGGRGGGARTKRGGRGGRGDRRGGSGGGYAGEDNAEHYALFRSWGLTGCVGCLSPDHKFTDWTGCFYRRCVFCAVKKNQEGAHVSTLCPERPGHGRNNLLAALANIGLMMDENLRIRSIRSNRNRNVTVSSVETEVKEA